MKVLNYKELYNTSIEELIKIKRKDGKKLALLYGNCQMSFINNYLMKMNKFMDEYILIIDMLAVQWLGNHERKSGINVAILQALDLFVYQNVSLNNQYSKLLATENILPQLSAKCKKIAIPNAYFMGYFPQHIQNRRYTLKGYNWPVVPYGDFVLETFFAKKRHDAELEQYITDEHLFSEEYVVNQATNSMKELKKREAACDIIISDYIEENYRKKHIFYTPSHPTNEITFELGKRILQDLGIKSNEVQDNLEDNNGIELLIYPSVKKHLGLKFEKKKFTFHKGLKKEQDDIVNYARNYGYFCFFEYDKNNDSSMESTNLYRTVVLNQQLVNARVSGSFIVKSPLVQLSLYLTILSNDLSEPIAYIPKEFAPKNDFYATGIILRGGENYKCVIKIGRSGELLCNTRLGDSVLSVDVSWTF